MSNRLEYKGYSTSIEIDFPSHLLYGRLEGVRDYVNFESESVAGIVQEFHRAVDDYVEFMSEVSACSSASEA